MKKNRVTFILRIIISVSLLGYLLFTSDIEQLFSLLGQLNYYYFGLVIFITILGLMLSTLKWKFLIALYDYHISYTKLLSINWTALFFSNFLPSTIGGDVYRIMALTKVSKSRFYSLLTVFLDRFTGALALTSVTIIALTATYKLLGKNLYILIGLIVFLVITTVLVLNEKAIEKILPIIKILPVANPKDKVNNLKESIAILKENKILFLKVMFLSLFFQLLAIVSSWIIALSLNYNVPFYYFVIFSPIIMLISVIPVSLNGIGIREAVTVMLFTSVNQLSKSQALLLSLSGYFVILLVSLFGSLAYALYKRSNII